MAYGIWVNIGRECLKNVRQRIQVWVTGDLTAMERENGLMSFAKHVRHVYIHIYIYNIHVLGFSLSSLFKAMVRRGTPSWNYFLGD